MSGRLRVGRSKRVNGRVIIPSYPGFTNIVVLTKQSSAYGELGPYHLKNEKGQLLESVWQASKAYQHVPQVSIPYSSGNSQIVWQWPAEQHLDEDGNPNDNYWKWRLALKNNPLPVRNPVGWKHLSTCAFALEKDEPISEDNPKLDYISARKIIYLPIYIKSVVNEPKYKELKQRLANGENLLIIEVDGPHQESLQYYKDKWGVDDSFIEQDSVEASERNLAILLEDPKHPFGHGYCLAWTLMTN